MTQGLNQIWLDAVNEDFPESAIIIDRLDKRIEHHSELIEDYYICKQQIKALEKSDKTELLNEYTIVFEDLKKEIQNMLTEIRTNSF